MSAWSFDCRKKHGKIASNQNCIVDEEANAASKVKYPRFTGLETLDDDDDDKIKESVALTSSLRPCKRNRVHARQNDMPIAESRNNIRRSQPEPVDLHIKYLL